MKRDGRDAKKDDSVPVLRRIEDDVLWLTINGTESRNALSNLVIDGLAAGIRQCKADGNIRAIVVTGAGDRAFCAGANLKADSRTFGFDYSQPSTAYADLLRAAAACTVPLIARVNGHCMAGGIGILSMCDMAVAVSTAKFGLPEVKIGLFPMQVAALLQRIMPPRKFAELCITGEPIGADEALAYGLLNYVVAPEELDAKIAWLVGRIVDKSPTAVRRGKYALRFMNGMSFDDALAYAEAQIGTLVLTEDAKEGMKAFNEKRPPAWTGR